MGLLKRIKDRLYYELVEKNHNIKTDYQAYVDANTEYHRRHRWKSWQYMRALNKYYRLISMDKNPTLHMAARAKKPAPPKMAEKPAATEAAAKPAALPCGPFLNGAESVAANRTEPHFFAKTLLQYEVVSFDVFDTLVLRPFAAPEEVSYILQDVFGIPDFRRIRLDAGRRAREKAQIIKGNREIDIFDIYREVSRMTGLDPLSGAETEFKVECDLCKANPYMKRVYNILREREKRIILISDMHYSEKQMAILLDKLGFTGYERIFVSCEHNAAKGNLKLYDVASRFMDVPADRIVHIGDNPVADVKNARTCGWAAKHYPNVNELGGRYRASSATGMSEIIGSVYGGIVNSHLLNGVKQYSVAYEYGFICGGIYVLGYCGWLIRQARKEGLSKLLLLARDGAIYQKVIKLLAPDIETEYVYWSRRAQIKFLAYKNRHEFLNNIVYRRKNDSHPTSIQAILTFLGLAEMYPLIRPYGFELTDRIIPDNSRQLENFFVDNWDKVIESFSKDDSFGQFFERIVGTHKKVGVADVGWRGSGVLGIKELIENKYKLPCKAKCYMAGARSSSPTDSLNYLHDETVEVYAFSRFYNRSMFEHFAKKGNYSMNSVFEIFTQAQSPAFTGLQATDGGQPRYVFGTPECENYETVKEIHTGIYDYCKIYTDTFKNYPFLLNIPGHDAMIPFKHISSHPEFYLRQFGDFIFPMDVISSEDVRLKPVSEVFKGVK